MFAPLVQGKTTQDWLAELDLARYLRDSKLKFIILVQTIYNSFNSSIIIIGVPSQQQKIQA